MEIFKKMAETKKTHLNMFECSKKNCLKSIYTTFLKLYIDSNH